MIQALVVLARRVLTPPLASAHPASPLLRGRPRSGSLDAEESPGEAGGEFARLVRDRPRVGSGLGQGAHRSLDEESDDGSTHREREGGAGAREVATTLELALPSVGPAAMPPQTPPPPALTAQQRAASALQELWPVLVRRVAWEGDAHDGTMRLELGAGALSGATLLVRCEGSRVRVSLSDPAGGNLDAWRARIGARLLAAGLDVDAVD